ncbi:MAG: hypothetical protein R3185_07065 [Candidatus Thermoplasmatota archaeon]|nr:hypothetical protein [Candidatus Thermoplasmatota archaeon]
MRKQGRIPLITGFVLLFMITGILVTDPGTFVGQGATFIDTEGWARTGGGVPVETQSYLRSSEDMEAFPASFEGWNLTADISKDWNNVKETFQADTLVSRYYTTSGLYLPVHLFIIDSKYTRVLHSLPVSYGLQGYEPLIRETILLNVTNENWLDPESPNQQIPVVEMTFAKKNSTTGEVLERRLVHFFWVKREAFGVTNHMTWVGTNMPVPAQGSIEDHQRLLSNFTTDVTAQIFVPHASDVPPTVAHALWKEEPQGPVLLGASMAVPMTLIGYGMLISRPRKDQAS